jgi:hypothetical protein
MVHCIAPVGCDRIVAKLGSLSTSELHRWAVPPLHDGGLLLLRAGVLGAKVEERRGEEDSREEDEHQRELQHL